MSLSEKEFNPDWVCSPGATIADALMERQLSFEDLAARLERSIEDIRSLVDGRIRITEDLAKLLADTIGASASFWLTREAQYRRDVRRLEAGSATAKDWLKELPVSDMIKFGWIPNSGRAERAATCLDFFGVESVSAWRAAYGEVLAVAAYRASPSFVASPAATAAWLRQGELKSAAIACAPFDAARFSAAITDLRALTRVKSAAEFVPAIRDLCAPCGVAVVVARAPKGCRASGATRLVSKDRALLLLSFRYLADDQFWFSFFHEAAHLILHSGDRTFIEGLGTTSREEAEADDFATRTLIPDALRSEFERLPLDLKPIAKFARAAGVSPGIVVGQLQERGRVARNHWNDLKVRYDWAELGEL